MTPEIPTPGPTMWRPPEEARPADAPVVRRYDLDALRGVAMLLGIVLHAAIPFIPYYENGDTGAGALEIIFEAIHGFRMPLFFLLSGFFTTMLFRRRGLRALVRHRVRRVGLPLLASMLVILPLVVVGILGGLAIGGFDLDELEESAAYEEGIDEEIRGEEAEAAAGIDLAHLWFLAYLMWLVAAFAVVVLVGRRLGRAPPGLIRVVMWLLPAVTILPQLSMTEGTIGPDTVARLVPAPHLFIYYGCFFAFGALAYDLPARDGRPMMDAVGRRWPIQLAAGFALLFPLGRHLATENWEASSVLQVAFAWAGSLGFIGLFRSRFSEPSFRSRYLSDSAYWLYLAHIPLVFVFQGLSVRLGLPAIPGFIFITVAVSAVLLVTYGWFVRYRFLGEFLNGRRTRTGDQRIKELAAS